MGFDFCVFVSMLMFSVSVYCLHKFHNLNYLVFVHVLLWTNPWAWTRKSVKVSLSPLIILQMY